MAKLNTYLTFKGDAEEAFNFYKSVFGGEFSILQKFRDMPGNEGMSIPDLDKIMHVTLEIPGGMILMASDDLESMGRPFIQGNNISLSLTVASEAEADQLFTALSAGANVTMPMEKTFWNAYFGMLTDSFGIHWMINYDYPATEAH